MGLPQLLVGNVYNAIPYILLPAISVLNRMKQASVASVVAYFLGGASILMTGIIALTDPVIGPTGVLSGVKGASPLFSTNIPLFMDHSFLTWWSFFNDSILYGFLIVVFPLVIFTYWAFVGSVKIKKEQLKDIRRASLQATARFEKIFRMIDILKAKLLKGTTRLISSLDRSPAPEPQDS